MLPCDKIEMFPYWHVSMYSYNANSSELVAYLLNLYTDNLSQNSLLTTFTMNPSGGGLTLAGLLP